MKIAVVARPPVYGGKVATVDSSDAEKVPGVERIVRLPEATPPTGFQALGGVAVVANNTWAAMQGRKKLKITWADGPNASYDSERYRVELEKAVREARQGGALAGQRGPRAQDCATRVSADYYLPHLAHASMEPPGRARRVRERSLRHLVLHPESRCHARNGGAGARHPGRERRVVRDAAGRRLRAEVEAGLCRRGGAAVEGDGARR